MCGGLLVWNPVSFVSSETKSCMEASDNKKKTGLRKLTVPLLSLSLLRLCSLETGLKQGPRRHVLHCKRYTGINTGQERMDDKSREEALSCVREEGTHRCHSVAKALFLRGEAIQTLRPVAFLVS
jgi:hypothetical protein